MELTKKKLEAASYGFGRDWFKMFQRMDRDHSGSLNLEEFRLGLRRVARVPKHQLSDTEIEQLFIAIDASGEQDDTDGTGGGDSSGVGQISRTEFAAFMDTDMDIDHVRNTPVANGDGNRSASGSRASSPHNLAQAEEQRQTKMSGSVGNEVSGTGTPTATAKVVRNSGANNDFRKRIREKAIADAKKKKSLLDAKPGQASAATDPLLGMEVQGSGLLAADEPHASTSADTGTEPIHPDVEVSENTATSDRSEGDNNGNKENDSQIARPEAEETAAAKAETEASAAAAAAAAAEVEAARIEMELEAEQARVRGLQLLAEEEQQRADNAKKLAEEEEAKRQHAIAEAAEAKRVESEKRAEAEAEARHVAELRAAAELEEQRLAEVRQRARDEETKMREHLAELQKQEVARHEEQLRKAAEEEQRIVALRAAAEVEEQRVQAAREVGRSRGELIEDWGKKGN